MSAKADYLRGWTDRQNPRISQLNPRASKAYQAGWFDAKANVYNPPGGSPMAAKKKKKKATKKKAAKRRAPKKATRRARPPTKRAPKRAAKRAAPKKSAALALKEKQLRKALGL